MRLDQLPHIEITMFTKVYVFLRDRDARIIELFFLALNIYVFALIVFPPYSATGMSLLWRILFQSLVVLINFLALLRRSKHVRILSSIANASIMVLIGIGQISMSNPNAGTYILLALLAIFVTWKINIKTTV